MVLVRLLTTPLVNPYVWALLFWAATSNLLSGVILGAVRFGGLATALLTSMSLFAGFVSLGILCRAADHAGNAFALGHAGRTPGRQSLNPFGHLPAAAMIPPGLMILAMLMGLNSSVFMTVFSLPVVGLVVLSWVRGGREIFHIENLSHDLKGLGFSIVPLTLLLTLAAQFLANALMAPLGIFHPLLAAYVYVAAFAVLGWVVYARRSPLDFETEHSPEQRAGAAHVAAEAELDTLFQTLHQHCRVDRYAEALSALMTYIETAPDERHRLVRERMKRFAFAKMRLAHALKYLDHLAKGKRGIAAWLLLRECIDEDAAFRPESGATMASALLAADDTDVPLLVRLLAEFGKRYPASPHLGDVKAKHVEVVLEWQGKEEVGNALLHDLERTHSTLAARFQQTQGRDV